VRPDSDELGGHGAGASRSVSRTACGLSPKPSNSHHSESTRVCDAVSQQSMILVMVRILENKPFQRAGRVRTSECLPFKKVLKMLLVHVTSECERVLEAPRLNIRGETNIAEIKQTLGSRTPHKIDIRLGIEEAGLGF
jgi:hypothetical protein